MPFQTINKYQFQILFLVVLASRLPFLAAGFGVEEDSWGMVNAMRRMGETGVYEISRLPGHPVIEAVYYLIRNQNAFVWNLITAIISAAGIVFFSLSLKKAGIKYFILCALFFAFIPVVYINSVCNMDYMWALSFIFISLFFVLDKKFLMAGFMLVLATGCRLTSLAMLFPFFFLMFDKNNLKPFLYQYGLLVLVSCGVSLLCFIPIIQKFGWHLFGGSLAYPEITKSIYKGTIGMFGVPGFAAVCFYMVKSFAKTKIKNILAGHPEKPLFNFIISGIIIHLILFVIVPHKSAYLIPVLLFIVFWFAISLSKNQLMILGGCLLFSNFLMGINLDDNFRGVKKSRFSVPAIISGQTVSFDLFKGNLLADHERRLQKMEFAKLVNTKLRGLSRETILIAGWWINEIDVLAGKDKNPLVKNYYFISESELQNSLIQGYDIFYLPLQDDVNDFKYGYSFTKKYARPMFEETSGFVF